LFQVTVHCLDPKYPVFVNEEEVNGEGRLLKHGDIVDISDFRFKWKREEPL
jgi:ribosome-associated protein YbcJ (S4-like RNA binding protein)